MTYNEVWRLHKDNNSGRKIAKKLGISRNTVSKYLNMDSMEMSVWLASTQTRAKKLDEHKELILEWLRKHQDMSSAQVYDWLEERGIEVPCEATVRNYVKELREKHHIPKVAQERIYEAIPDSPLGHQAQVDFGEICVHTIKAIKVKLFVIAFVLSNSRYKYMFWQDKHFTTEDVVLAHQKAFKYFGGKPKEIVYDQDSLIIVSENSGDLIMTNKFDSYRNVEPFDIFMCRKADPESKGRIENVIGFIKNNFAKNRVFIDLESWNEDAMKWLKRRGNGKTHNTTKKIPAEAFEAEKGFLTPVSQASRTNQAQPPMIRKVRKDNTVAYLSNRYSVPLGTYRPTGMEVELQIDENTLLITGVETGEILAEHAIPAQKGILVKHRSHTRNRKAKIDELIERAKGCFGNTVRGNVFVEYIREKYPRYLRDQFQIIFNLAESAAVEDLNKAAEYCTRQKLYSANDLRDMYNYLFQKKGEKPVLNILGDSIDLNDDESSEIIAEITKANLEVYMKLLEDN